ncbi:MAG: helicase [Rhodospirillaceae bacterium]|nr:helicase [Rhodospirillaceae bacterium]|tara:strand:- start:2646 stop:5417 length:2772 start_codon:yes stop_codon:yes gene_type:complete
MDTPLPLQAAEPASARNVLVAGLTDAIILSPDGDPRHISQREAGHALKSMSPPIICHRPTTSRRLRLTPFASLDILELFAFARPAQFCLPTPGGIAAALDLEKPDTLEEQAVVLRQAVDVLLAELADFDPRDEPDALPVAQAMQDGSWAWGPMVTPCLQHLTDPEDLPRPRRGLDVWMRLHSWAEQAPEPPPESFEVTDAEARTRLAELVGDNAEPRPQQADYASAVSAAFAPRAEVDTPNVVIAEAGTGVGKTLGYIAPASVWSEKNGGAVWISTYTRNLQRQIDDELDRLHPDPEVKARHVVIRKGRENYLCLLNMEEAVGRSPTRPASAVGLGLLARWAARTRSGDIVGGDFPTWLTDLVGFRDTLALADRRGECIYSACSHYSKCFVERTVRQARRADIVVANHALVMTQAALGGLDDGNVPTRIVFDEGHHLFDSADSAFSAELSGRQGVELRRWLLGAESGGRSRARGLQRRIEDLIAADPTTGEAMEEVKNAAQCLPQGGWAARLADGERPRGPAESFLALVRQQVYARAKDPNSPYDLESDTHPPIDELHDAAAILQTALGELSQPMKALIARLAYLLDAESDNFDSHTRQRVEAACRGLTRRAEGEVDAWRSMLAALRDEVPEEFVDWFSVSRDQGRDSDAAMHRHWIDPTMPFAHHVARPAHGVVMTSATLRDSTGDNETDWMSAETVTGASHLPAPAIRAYAPSPFDYPAQTKVFVVTDVSRTNGDQVAAAYRELFLAANGGALGLFTAIARLRTVHGKIAAPLEQAGLPLLAQHVDGMDTASLIEIFREEENSCILGTDAIRDGVDVPGRALRLVVFDRVPWPRPTILHRARKGAFGGTAYDDRITRLRLKQAYGRLVRRAGDHGVFVILDSRTPTRLLTAFPEGVEVERIGLADAIANTKAFLESSASAA